MNDNIKIDWKKYVDQIYCITLTKRNNENLYKELKRVDILDSGIYYEKEFINSPLFKTLYNNFNNNEVIHRYYNYSFDNLMSNYYYMKHAKSHDYKKILIIEDDVVFLKNKKYIIDILESYNNIEESNTIFLGNLIHFDMYNFDEIGWSYENIFYYYDRMFRLNINKVEPNISILGGAAFNMYDYDAYNNMINLIENYEFFSIDSYKFLLSALNLNMYYNDTNVCIQHDDIYKAINWFYLYNLDIYEDYVAIINKDDIINNFKEVIYPNVFKDYIYLDGVKKYVNDYFNQINFLIFDNKLNINDIIK